MPASPKPEVTRDREREAWSLRVQGWTQQMIADHLGVTQPAVWDMLQRTERKLAAQFKDRAEHIKLEQTEQLEWIATQALKQWHRSCEDGVTEVTVKGKTTGTKGAKGEAGDQSKAQVTRTVVGQSGNPALLEKALKAMADIRAIWGAEAPRKLEGSGPGGGPIEFRDVTGARQELGEALARTLDTGGAGAADPDPLSADSDEPEV